VLLDIGEGADMVMVKPAMPYLDVIRRRARGDAGADRRLPGQRRVRDADGRPRAGLLDERAAALEALTAIKRAGADLIITYHASRAAVGSPRGRRPRSSPSGCIGRRAA
jgi:porphobilinogen synthase